MLFEAKHQISDQTIHGWDIAMQKILIISYRLSQNENPYMFNV
jgi:hypothetical protein